MEQTLRNMRLLVTLLLTLSVAPLTAQQSIKVMHYNLLLFGDCDGVSTSEKYQWLGTILEHVQPDIFTVNELIPQTAYINGIKALSFDYTSEIEAYPFTNQANSNIVNTLFYNKTKFMPMSAQGEVIPYSLRDLNAYRLLYLPSIADGSTDSLFVRCIVGHFKAGQGSSNESSRTAAANLIMNYLANVPNDEAVLVMGDMNVYSHQENAFQALVNGSASSERLIDVTGTNTTGWNGGANAIHHTQSTRNSATDCGSGGGMDDRFDIVLASQSLIDPSSLIRIDSSSYKALGNNGQSYNTELGCSGNNTVPFQVCLALKQMSDHLPVVLDLIVDGSVSIEEDFASVEVETILNRNSETLEISVPGEPRWSYRFGNLSGQVLSSNQVTGPEATLNISTLPRGMYWLVVETTDGRLSAQKILWK